MGLPLEDGGRELFSLALNPAAYFRVQHVERQGAIPQHLIVKDAEVESVAELLSGRFSQLQNLELSEFIRQGLAGEAM